MSGTSGHKLDSIVLGRDELMDYIHSSVSNTCLLCILSHCEAISPPVILCLVNVKLNRKNMEFSFPWAHSPERSPGGNVSWYCYD